MRRAALEAVGLLVVFGLSCTAKKPEKASPQPQKALPEVQIQAPPRALPALDFAAYGDCRSNRDVHRKICADILATKAKFVLVTGDLVDWGGSEQGWEMFHEDTRELRSKADYYAAAGNHDVSAHRYFEKEFGLEKSYYEKRIGDIALFLLDSNLEFTDAAQIRWLEERAKASDAKHKIAVFHHPPFGIDPGYRAQAEGIRGNIHPLLARLKFCAAFCGHHHHFYTTLRDGVRYVITAGGGAPLYDVDPSLGQKGDLWKVAFHWIGCRVLEKGITAQVFEPNGDEARDLAFTLCEHP